MRPAGRPAGREEASALLALAGLLAVGSIGACDDAPPPGSATRPAWVVSDSAGVPVVENHRPATAEAGRLAPRPLVLGGVDQPARFGRPVDVRFRPGGGLLVADGGRTGWQMVFLFDEEGVFVERCGHAGSGAGGFARLVGVRGWRADSVVAMDGADGSLTFFGPACERGRTLRVAEPVEAATLDGVLPGGELVVGLVPEGETVRRELVLDADGRVQDTVTVVRRPAAQQAFPTQPSVAAGGGVVVHAPGRPFELRVHAPDGSLERIVRRGWEAHPVGEEERLAFARWSVTRGPAGSREGWERPRSARHAVGELRWPATTPAVSAVVVANDGSIWAEAYRWLHDEIPPEPEPARWSVFSPRGRWVADVRVPAGFLVTDVRVDATGVRVAGVYATSGGHREVRVYRLLR